MRAVDDASADMSGFFDCFLLGAEGFFAVSVVVDCVTRQRCVCAGVANVGGVGETRGAFFYRRCCDVDFEAFVGELLGFGLRRGHGGASFFWASRTGGGWPRVLRKFRRLRMGG